MEAYVRPERSARGALRRRRRRATGLLSLALLIVMASVALLLSPLTERVSASAPTGAPLAPAADTPTVTPTPPAGPPTLTLVSPSSASGPVGAKLTIAGDNWSGTVSVGAIPSPGDCSNKGAWLKSFGSPKANGAGHISFTFTWPNNLSQTSSAYQVCATNASGTASVNYQVLSPAPPMIAFSANTAQVGTLLTINGSNFLGVGSITITAQAGQGSQRLVTTVAPLDNGTFSVPFTPTVRDVGTVTVRATSASEGGAPAAVSVSAKIQVTAAATPTATVSPTPTTAIAIGGGTSTPTNTGTSVTAVVLIVVAILFALLAIAGVGVFLWLRRRGTGGGPDGEDPAYYGYGAQPGGYGPYDQTAYGGAAYGGQPGQFGGSGYPGAGGAYPGQSVGGVAMWGDQPEEGYQDDSTGPGPDWHPRPMTGHWRAPDASDFRSGGYDRGGVDPQDAPGYAPPDPWATDGTDPYRTSRAPAGNPGAPGYGQGVNGPSRGDLSQPGRNPWGESWRDAPQGRQSQSGYPRQPGNDDEPEDPNGYTGW